MGIVSCIFYGLGLYLLSLGVPTDTLPSADELMAELERAHFGGVPLSPERAEQLLAACAGALETA